MEGATRQKVIDLRIIEVSGIALCTAMVYGGALKWVWLMNRKNQKVTRGRVSGMPRASVSFPPELYRALEELAKKKKVSIAWVVREAAEQYVSAEWPLFGSIPREVK